MPLMDRFRGQRGQPRSETVTCPTCHEENPVGSLLCQHCKGVLPPPAGEAGPVTVSVTATAPTAVAAAAVKATAASPATVRCPSCGEAAPVGAIICPFCRDVLPPRPEQLAPSAEPSRSEQAT